MKRLLLLLLFVSFASASGFAQDSPKYEFRGAWIATVINLDWPTSPSSSPSLQRAQLRFLLDALQEAGINAVIFQVRSEADAMYPSDTEPWSYWLTGEQGTGPDPFYDPLQFAIDETHARGMELHAWFNPYRVIRGSGYPNSSDHVSVEHPDWLLAFGDLRVLDPGLPDVREYVTGVIAEVVERYDVDGVHFDDYFYPYPPNNIDDEDDATFEAYPRGFTNIGDWRRDNVDLLVESVRDTIQAVNPEVVFGISPFGIWKNGVPPGIVGLDAYNVIFADATAWLDAETIDYLAPQLYWAFGGGQDYGRLAPWWGSVSNGRHIYPGLGLYRDNYSNNEIPRQITLNRELETVQGQILFRAQFVQTNQHSATDSLKQNYYRHPALPPIMPWRSQDAPATPEDLAFEWDGEAANLSWSPPASSAADSARFYAVYRIQSATEPDYDEALMDARNLLAITADTTLSDRPIDVGESYYYVVTGVSANSIESEPSNAISLEGMAVDTDATAAPLAFRLEQSYPNPFSDRATIVFSLQRATSVTLRVYDVLGRTVATLAEGVRFSSGPHTVEWDGTDGAGRRLAGGTYFYTLEADGQRATKAMTLIR